MPETLLSFSEILLFGRLVEDLFIRSNYTAAAVSAKRNIPLKKKKVDGVLLDKDDLVLITKQSTATENELYKVDGSNNWTIVTTQIGDTIRIDGGRNFDGSLWKKTDVNEFINLNRNSGRNSQLDRQMINGLFARIYGFGYEGAYYELPAPTLFLVHDEGQLVSEDTNSSKNSKGFPSNLSRAPRDPSIGGLAVADFQFADDIKVWAYDKADYTVRMDVATGMFEQVLLDATLGDGGFGVSGAKVSGAKVSGAKVSGAKVSGAKVSGAKARGPGD